MRNWRLELLPYLSATWQYRWYGLAAAWVICVLAWLTVAAIPNTYQSQSEVYIDTHNLLGPLLQGLAITTDPNQEIQVMLQQLLTAPTLESVVRATNPKAASMSSGQIQDAVAELRKQVSLKNLQVKDLYNIAYTDRDPASAQSVAQTLVSVLIDSSLGGQRRDANQAGAFLDDQIAKYQQKLEAADKRRADFKTANLNLFSATPDGDQVGGAGDVVAAQTALSQAQHTLDEAIDRRNSLRKQLDATSKTLSLNEPLPATMENNGTALSPRAQLAAAIAKLNMLRTQYTDNYPDVVMQKRLIRRLQSQQTAESGDTKGISNPVYVMMMTKVTDAEGEVAVDNKRLEYAKKQLEQAKALTAKAISIQRQYQDLDRDYQVLHTNYETLVSRRESASITQAVGNQQSAFAFRVISPPMKPQTPVAPNRLLLNAAVLFLGLGAGAGLAFALGQFSGRLLSMEQLKEAFELPILGTITTVRTSPDRVAVRRATAFFAAGLGMLVATCLIVLFFSHTGTTGLSV